MIFFLLRSSCMQGESKLGVQTLRGFRTLNKDSELHRNKKEKSFSSYQGSSKYYFAFYILLYSLNF